MNADIIPLPNLGRIMLLVLPDSMSGALFELAARLVLQGPLYVVDGGNTFQAYPLARYLRRQTQDVAGMMSRVILSRVFTCYQMAALSTEGTFAPYPFLMLDFLATFYDQGVRVSDRRRLLRLCLQRLDQLSRCAPVLVWVRQRAVIPEDAVNFLDIVRSFAGEVWWPDKPALVAPRQPSLFSRE